MTTRLYHFTCRCCADKIGARGILLPHANPMFPSIGPVVWLTSMEQPDATALGLQSTVLKCDRTEVRYVAENPPASPWGEYAILRRVPIEHVTALEIGRRPGTWWVSTEPVSARRTA